MARRILKKQRIQMMMVKRKKEKGEEESKREDDQQSINYEQSRLRKERKARIVETEASKYYQDLIPNRVSQ